MNGLWWGFALPYSLLAVQPAGNRSGPCHAESIVAEAGKSPDQRGRGSDLDREWAQAL